MGYQNGPWPYGPTLLRLLLALAIGLFIGIERERRRKEAGLRTFAFAALLGGVGGLLDDRFALLALALLGILVILLNVETIHSGEGAEITTSAALILTGFAGVLAGKGHTFTPTALGVATAGLLAWKQPLAGFSQALTESEFRSAVLLSIIAFVVYPVLPAGSVDPWRLVEPRAAWITVILIAALGFANYILLKLYGARGIELTGFLGGLVNSTVTVTELAHRARESRGEFSDAAFQGVVLATTAMLIRNGVILTVLAPAAFRDAVFPLMFMLAGTLTAAFLTRQTRAAGSSPVAEQSEQPLPGLASPFSPTAALRFGAIFLVLQIVGTVGERLIGTTGFYGVSFVGGMVSSASAVAAAANLTTAHTIPAHVAGVAAAIASATSAIVDLPIVARVSGDPRLTRRVSVVVGCAVALGAAGALLERAFSTAIGGL
jgi:uncharacterized membrane protein (DUF4010 family)